LEKKGAKYKKILIILSWLFLIISSVAIGEEQHFKGQKARIIIPYYEYDRYVEILSKPKPKKSLFSFFMEFGWNNEEVIFDGAEKDGWCRIKTGRGKTGWIQKKYLKFKSPFEPHSEDSVKIVDIKELFNKLRELAPHKDKFETTAEHIKKLEQVVPEEIYAFRLKNSYNTKAETIPIISTYYNADTQELSYDLCQNHFEAAPHWTPGGNHCSRKGIAIERELKGQSTYHISNVFAPFSVTSRTFEDYGIVMPNQSPFFAFWKISLEVPPETAKKMVGKTNILLVCKVKLSPEFAEIWGEAYEYRKPTIDCLDTTIRTTKYITVEILEIWIEDTVKHEIYYKLDPWEFLHYLQ